MSFNYTSGRTMFASSPEVYRVSLEEQTRSLIWEEKLCFQKRRNYTAKSQGLFCEPTWDRYMCWDETPAGTTAIQGCPSYIDGLLVHGVARKTCTLNGTWFIHPIYNTTWTDYSGCQLPEYDLTPVKDDLLRINQISTIGYALSLSSLLLSVVIMIGCRKLRSKISTLHINLFLAFIFRAIIALLKEGLFVNGLGLEKDIKEVGPEKYEFQNEGTHWECKLLVTILVYTIGACSMWIHMEALYLFMLIHRTMYTKQNGIKIYILLGWLGPLAYVIPWVFVRIFKDNYLCWNTNPTPEYVWIIRGPLYLMNFINLLFFINIVRVLFIRVNKNRQNTAARKVRKLAKFIGVLIPLFGVLYIVFSIMSHPSIHVQTDVPYLYCEMIYNSFQGLLLATIFCFTDGKVRAELKNIWLSCILRRNESLNYTKAVVLSSMRETTKTSPGRLCFVQGESRQSSQFKDTSQFNLTTFQGSRFVQKVFIFKPGTCEELNCNFVNLRDGGETRQNKHVTRDDYLQSSSYV